MTDSTKDLLFTDYSGGKVVGTHLFESWGNALVNKSAKEIIIPEKYLGVKVTEIGQKAFGQTNIESIFISRYIKTILHAAFWICKSLKYITFDVNSELEETDNDIFASTKIESINIPLSWKSYKTYGKTFDCNSNLICVSYLGSMDLSYTNFISNSPSSLVAHANPSYSYKFGTYSPVKDSQKCPEKIFLNQMKKRSRGCTCYRRTNRIPLNTLITLLVVS